MFRIFRLTAALLCGAAAAQNLCSLHLADQSAAPQGFILSLDSQSDVSGVCPLSALRLNLTAGSGATSAAPSWQMGVVYTAKLTLTAAGPQQWTLNGQPLPSLAAAFQPAAATLYGALIPSSAQGNPAAYVITQISLQVTNGASNVSIAPNGANPIPLPLVLLASGPAPWPAPFAIDATQPTTVTATFRIDPKTAADQFDPYVDKYGQAVYGAWPGKAVGDTDLAAAAAEEQAWFAANPSPAGLDTYGGSTIVGWKDLATNYYHAVFRNNRWWLISPLGNPVFHLGLDSISTGVTPVSGRLPEFQLPPQNSDTYPQAYHDSSTIYVSYTVANEMLKYGGTWKSTQHNLGIQRMPAWGFTGSGKWTSDTGIPVNPVLDRSAAGTVVPGGHPDVFDPAVMSQLQASLQAQIQPDRTNPNIIGWSVGNEKDEILQPSEVNGILGLGASVPAKQALVTQALNTIYGGNVKMLARDWGISASTLADVYAATNANPPTMVVQALRQYYAGAYYVALRDAVKSFDPNHLYICAWLLREYLGEWPAAAANCDVLGIDYYAPSFPTAAVDAQLRALNMPVLVGEFSYPSAYGGTRGFGWSGYITPDITLTESASGDAYTRFLQSVSAYPYVVGAEWFQYRDEPVSGRGNTNGIGNTSTSLVVGEDLAFGMVDVTDRPKYDLVNKVRAANIATLQGLGLIGTASRTAVAAATPASGSGATESLIVTFSDPHGWQDLNVVNVLIHNFLVGSNACYLAYSRPTGVLYLVADNGVTLLPGLALGAAGSVANSQCTVMSAGSSAFGSGNVLTLILNITFSGSFGGNRIVYTAAGDLQGGNSKWQALGVWQAPFTPAGVIAVGGLNPARAAMTSGAAQTLTATLTDGNGAGDFGVVNLLLNDFLDGKQACYLAYVASINTLVLVDDAGHADGPFAGSLVLNGGAGTIQNSQCSVSGAGSSVVKSGNTLRLALNIAFKSPFAGNRIVWVAGRDDAAGNNTDWQAMGTVAVQ
jgi:hypothetical protein